MNVTGYIRVSTDDQLLSIDAQRQAIQELARKHGLPEPTIYVDHGISGSTPHYQRVGLSDLLASKPTHLLATKRDRLARDVLQALFIEKELLKHGAALITGDAPSDDDPGSQLMRAIIDAFAQYERRMISHRTKLALAQLKAKGMKFGGCKHPYGTKPGEDQIIAICKANMHKKPRFVVAELNSLGYKTRKGNAFTAEEVKGIWKRQCK